MPLIVWACLATFALVEAQPITVFTTPSTSPYVATEGKAALAWETDALEDAPRFELQQSSDQNFSDCFTRYEGLDQGTYVSGLPEGDYYYRVRTIVSDDESGPWSESLQIQVRYVSHTIVFWLMAIGSLVFLATLLTVIKGHLNARRSANSAA